jgi:hypothetical protein
MVNPVQSNLTVMKKRLLIPSLLLLLSSPGIVSSQAPSIASPKFVIGQQPSTPSAPKVEVLNPGAEPRQQLRFKPAVNTKQTSVMKFDVDMEMSISSAAMPKVELPTNVITIDTTVNRIDPNGDIHYEFRYSKIDVIDNGKVPKPVLEAMTAQNKKLVGIGGNFVADNRGYTKSGRFTVPKDLDPTTRQVFDQLSQSINQFSYPLPEAAIGKGAQWRVTSPLTISGITLTQTATYQLVSLQNGVVTIDVSLTQKAQPQKLTQPGLPSGAVMTLKSLNSQGKGKINMRLDQLLPTKSNISMQSTNEINTTNTTAPGEVNIITKSLMEMIFESKL